jgi:hypothetical protein
MAWSFADSFDLYATAAAGGDMAPGYWDSLVGAITPGVAGRFTGSRGVQLSSTCVLVKNSGQNDPVHHIVCSYEGTTSSALGPAFTLMDGATAQCTILIETNGTVLLQAGALGGATLASWASGMAINTWYALEFEVVISNTAGSIAIRKNGNPANDFFLGSLNTRVSANNYANALKLCSSINGGNIIDDLFWQSGAATGTWLGDIRCYTRMPASDASVQFSRNPTTITQTVNAASTTASGGVIPISWYTPFTPNYDGSISSFTFQLNAGYTGNMKGAIFADNAGSPGAVLGSGAAPVNNPVTGVNTFTVSPPVAITKGTKIWLGICPDTAISSVLGSSGVGKRNQTVSYASFPAANPTIINVDAGPVSVVGINIGANYNLVCEPQQDGATTYVYDSNPGDADFYGLAAIGATPAVVYATVVRGYMQKSDAGSRTASVQLKSGATTVASPTVVLTTSGWLWTWRMDLTDPNTGAAWTPSGVNNAQIGPKVVA